jgi:hypothetical protein
MQAGSNQKQKTKPVASNANTDQRGTKDFPFIVDTEGHRKTPAEEAEAKRKDDDNERFNRRTLYATIGSAIFAGFAALFTGLLVRIGRNGVNAAKETLKAIEGQLRIMQSDIRPWFQSVPITWDRLGISSDDQGTFSVGTSIDIRVQNIGKSPALLDGIDVRLLVSPIGESIADRLSIIHLSFAADKYKRPMLFSDSFHRHSSYPSESIDVPDKSLRVFLVISVAYISPSGDKQHRTTNCYVYEYDNNDSPVLIGDGGMSGVFQMPLGVWREWTTLAD